MGGDVTMSDELQLGKKGEAKVKEWLTHPDDGFFLLRLYDQMS